MHSHCGMMRQSNPAARRRKWNLQVLVRFQPEGETIVHPANQPEQQERPRGAAKHEPGQTANHQAQKKQNRRDPTGRLLKVVTWESAISHTGTVSESASGAVRKSGGLNGFCLKTNKISYSTRTEGGQFVQVRHLAPPHSPQKKMRAAKDVEFFCMPAISCGHAQPSVIPCPATDPQKLSGTETDLFAA